MVALIDFKKQAIDRYTQAEGQLKVLTALEEQGIISDRFKRYCNQILLLDCLSKEAEAFALHGNIKESYESILEMRKFLIGVQCNYAQDMIKKPQLRNSYQELFNLAYDRYNLTLNNLNKLTGAEI
ncbi:MAG: hypothetical protein AABW67_05490 [Nanoarchaeota archaeon]